MNISKILSQRISQRTEIARKPSPQWWTESNNRNNKKIAQFNSLFGKANKQKKGSYKKHTSNIIQNCVSLKWFFMKLETTFDIVLDILVNKVRQKKKIKICKNDKKKEA